MLLSMQRCLAMQQPMMPIIWLSLCPLVTKPESQWNSLSRLLKLTPPRLITLMLMVVPRSLNDKIETKIIKQIFGENAYKIPISSNKSMIGHALGAAGSIELIASVLTIKHQFIPPTINYEFPDPECDLDYVPNKARNATVTTVLKNSFGFGGKNSNIIIRKYE